ncbi:hypothetical protein [Rhodococcus koreensis]|uniref:Antitoxin VbhA domain-containing protein n=1 Tax=Rhodococcus koreensis TaxID=99653 RepID=A0A1H4I6F9_9NOCA|nr:hypothetical protein [Rhodococcus koreensis]SEB29346.1 hypothetical protein SAMN04490239_0075 [Rhodococcus koreensis]
MNDDTAHRGLTEAQARAEYDRLAPIMAIEGRTMDEPTKELLVQLLQENITLDDALDSILRRRAQTEQ